jgi:hypothetical protein
VFDARKNGRRQGKLSNAKRSAWPIGTATIRRLIRAYSHEVAAAARKAFASLRKRLPAADILVYDNYNALAIGFGPNERASDVAGNRPLKLSMRKYGVVR